MLYTAAYVCAYVNNQIAVLMLLRFYIHPAIDRHIDAVMAKMVSDLHMKRPTMHQAYMQIVNCRGGHHRAVPFV